MSPKFDAPLQVRMRSGIWTTVLLVFINITAMGAGVGTQLLPGDSIDSAVGFTYVYQGHFPESSIGQAVTEWAFFNNQPSNNGSITPLILVGAGGNQWKIVGIGVTRKNAGTGKQHYPFELRDGSNIIEGANYTFGWWNGNYQGIYGGIGNDGVVEFSRVESIPGFAESCPFVGCAKDGGGRPAVGKVLTFANDYRGANPRNDFNSGFGRLYSVAFFTSPVDRIATEQRSLQNASPTRASTEQRSLQNPSPTRASTEQTSPQNAPPTRAPDTAVPDKPVLKPGVASGGGEDSLVWNDLPATGPQPWVRDEYGKKIPLYSASYALLISESNYPGGNSKWRFLPNTGEEMDRLASVLRPQGFIVRRVSDVKSAQLDNVIRSFKRFGWDKDARILIYFSGHGFTIPSNDFSYIVPIDAPDPVNQAAFVSLAYPLASFENLAREIIAKHALFIFDSCFSGGIFLTKADMPPPPAASLHEKERATFFLTSGQERVRQFISAGGPDQTLPAKSTFLDLLVGVLQGKVNKTADGYITGRELGEWLEQHVPSYVPKYAPQNPHSDLIREPRLTFGDMVFQVSSTADRQNH